MNFKNLSTLSLFGFLVTFFIPFNAFTQTYDRLFPKLTENGVEMDFGFAGGLNCPQFWEVDMNNDGIKDLFVFDRVGDVILPFLNGGTVNTVDYNYAPEYIEQFPSLRSWAIFRDFNCDGIEDIFCFSTVPGVGGISVFEGSYDSNNKIEFTQVLFPGQQFPQVLYYPIGSGDTQIYVSEIDIPAIDDIDGDGDIDILTFSIGGGYMELYNNLAVEAGQSCGSLTYVLDDDCWGRCYESGISPAIDLSPSEDSCAYRPGITGDIVDVRHAGSCLVTVDMDNDGVKELILGDLAFNNVTLLNNGGTADDAFITSQDVFFPSYDTPVDLIIFPAPFLADINNDGKKDFLAAPNSKNASENHLNAWYYKNIQSDEFPVFELQQDDFLTGKMLDHGSGAAPAFVDINADGLKDLVVGSYGYYNIGGVFDARLFLYHNTGTASNPEYTLITDDYLNLSNLGYQGLNPAFGDIDGDGDQDLIVGEASGKLVYYENTAGIGNAFNFATPIVEFSAIDIGQFATPCVFDIDKDGTNELVIGERSGNLNLFEFNGMVGGIPEYISAANSVGGVDTRPIGNTAGYSSPVFKYIDDQIHCFSGSTNGDIWHYDNIDGNIAGNFNVLSDQLAGIKEGEITLLSLSDIDNDDLFEMAVGNFRGGIEIFETDLPVSVGVDTNPPKSALQFSIFPNPANTWLNIKALNYEGQNLSYKLYNTLGQVVAQKAFIPPNNQLATDGFASGMYFLELVSGEESEVFKVEIRR